VSLKSFPAGIGSLPGSAKRATGELFQAKASKV